MRPPPISPTTGRSGSGGTDACSPVARQRRSVLRGRLHGPGDLARQRHGSRRDRPHPDRHHRRACRFNLATLRVVCAPACRQFDSGPRHRDVGVSKSISRYRPCQRGSWVSPRGSHAPDPSHSPAPQRLGRLVRIAQGLLKHASRSAEPRSREMPGFGRLTQKRLVEPFLRVSVNPQAGVTQNPSRHPDGLRIPSPPGWALRPASGRGRRHSLRTPCGRQCGSPSRLTA